MVPGVCWASKGRTVTWVREGLVSWSGKPVPSLRWGLISSAADVGGVGLWSLNKNLYLTHFVSV